MSELAPILIESFMEGGYILGKIYTAQLEGFANLLGEIISEKLVLKNEIREFKQELLDKQYNIDIEKESLKEKDQIMGKEQGLQKYYEMRR